MKEYSSIPFLICFVIYFITTIMFIMFTKSNNIWATLIGGVISITLIIFVNETAQNIKEKNE